MTPLARGILTSAKLGTSNFAKYFMAKFSSPNNVVVPADPSLALLNDFSACAWVYPHNRNQFQRIISKFGDSGNRAWFFDVGSTGDLVFGHYANGTNNVVFITTVDVPLNTLSLAHFRLTGGTLYVGINGTSEQSVARGAVFDSTDPNRVGAAGAFFSDDFDITQPMIFNSPSSLANFATIYNDGRPCKYSLITTSITDDAVMAFELSSNDETVTDLSTAGNDGAFDGGSFTNGQPATWKIGPTVSNPIDIFGSDLKQWFDTSDALTLFTDAGVTLVTTDEDRIYQMNDKSGNSSNATQTTLSRRPYYKTSVINGLDSADYRLAQQMNPARPAFYTDSVAAMFMFVVWKSDSLSQVGGLYSNYTNSGGDSNLGGLLFRQSSANETVIAFNSSGTAQQASPDIAATLDVQVIGMTSSGTSLKSYADGVLTGTVTMSSNMDMTTNPLYNSIGHIPSTDNQFCDGMIAEVVIGNVTPTAQQLADLQTYFSRWQ